MKLLELLVVMAMKEIWMVPGNRCVGVISVTLCLLILVEHILVELYVESSSCSFSWIKRILWFLDYNTSLGSLFHIQFVFSEPCPCWMSKLGYGSSFKLKLVIYLWLKETWIHLNNCYFVSWAGLWQHSIQFSRRRNVDLSSAFV